MGLVAGILFTGLGCWACCRFSAAAASRAGRNARRALRASRDQARTARPGLTQAGRPRRDTLRACKDTHPASHQLRVGRPPPRARSGPVLTFLVAALGLLALVPSERSSGRTTIGLLRPGSRRAPTGSAARRTCASTWSRPRVCCRCRRSAVEAVVFDELKRPDYIVSKVYFQSLPGFYVTGNLYRPVGDGPFRRCCPPTALVLRPPRELGARLGPGRAINLARQGLVVFTYDMVGYNDSRQLSHAFRRQAGEHMGLSLEAAALERHPQPRLRRVAAVRAEDAIGMTGESGGGSQTFLLAAADPAWRSPCPST